MVAEYTSLGGPLQDRPAESPPPHQTAASQTETRPPWAPSQKPKSVPPAAPTCRAGSNRLSGVNEIELKLRVDVESGPCARGGGTAGSIGGLPPHREGQRSAAPWKVELMDFSTAPNLPSFNDRCSNQ